MKILYDHQAFSMQLYGGISRYFSELMNQFINFSDIEFKIACKYCSNSYLNSNIRAYTFPKKISCIDKFYGRLNKCKSLNEEYSLSQLRLGDFDVFHPTYYDNYFIDHFNGKPFVTTVHDMIHELFFEMFNDSKIVLQKKKLIEHSDAIIAVSHNTKNDILKLFDDVDESKIYVIHHGYPDNTNLLKTDEKGNSNYLLFVGNRERYKNFFFFIFSMRAIIKELPWLNIQCIGGGKFSVNELKLIDILGMTGRIFQCDVSEDQIGNYYSNALALVYPSLYEGFGMPILEAFAFNCPVLCSDCSSLPEVAGDAAVFFNPKSIKSIQEAVKLLTHNEDTRMELINKGNRRLMDFNWKKTAKLTKNVYRSVF
jgi:glycosyltransferase involved in cell wall biosynthesis